MLGQGLRQLQAALNQKADSIQREFNAVGEALQALSRRVVDAEPAERERLLAELEALHDKQRALAEAANLWRDRARGALRQPSDEKLRAYLAELAAAADDEAVRQATEFSLYVLDAPEDELAKLAAQPVSAALSTPVGRLIERARTEFDLRGRDAAPRQAAAVEFANRPGVAQDDEVLVDLETALDDPDPLVKEILTLTLIQVLRFRAVRMADLTEAHAAVKRLTRFDHPAAIPVLIEVLETPRTGYVQTDGATTEGNNQRAREAALVRLVEWRTPAAQAALQARLQDRDSKIADLAARALEYYPGPWK